MANASASAEELGGAHPFDFHVSGPRNLSSPNWRDLFRSTWRDNNYRRTVMACFIQAVYLLELDRQENKTEEIGLAAKWWKPFKYKLSQILVDGRDGSIFGAIIEWDRYAALSDFILAKPSGAPRAVLALRGTLLKSQTIRRDLVDDLRFLAWESLKGSVRFNMALEALVSVVEKYGSKNVCIAGHSIGAGFALQVGKELAKKGIHIETHLFNPPSVSLATRFRSIGEKIGATWCSVRARFASNSEVHPIVEGEKNVIKGWGMIRTEGKKWVPNLYVNNSDYICCYYNDPAANENGKASGVNVSPKTGNIEENVSAKLFISSKGPKKFLEAHGLEQWWSDDMELELAINDSKLIQRQLKSLYSLVPSQGKPQR